MDQEIDGYIYSKLTEFDNILNSADDNGSALEKRIGALEQKVATLEERSKNHAKILYFLLGIIGLAKVFLG